jgi:hypothetical protein
MLNADLFSYYLDFKYQLLYNQNRHCPAGEIVRKSPDCFNTLIIKRYQSQISHLFYFIKNDSAISYIGN